MAGSVPIALQIDEVERELGLRRALHPGKIKARQISQTVSDIQIARIEAALKTLRWVRANEAAIAAKVGAIP